MKRSLYILAGNGPVTNHGCEALTRSTCDVVEHAAPGARFISSPEKQDVVLDRDVIRDDRIVHRPMSYPKRWSFPSLSLKVSRKLGRFKKYPFEPYLDETAAVLAVGGDNFTLDYGPHLPLRQVAMGEEVLRRGVPFVIWGASIGPFTANPDVEKRVADFLRRLPLVTIREKKTQAYLESIGVSDNVHLVSDPAFVLKTVEPEGLPELKALLQEKPICVNLSPLMKQFSKSGEPWSKVATDFVRLLDAEVDAPILLLPHVMWTVSDDHALLAEVLAALGKTRNRVLLAPRHLNALELKWIIARSRMLIASRTHATIGAFSQGIPTISVGYSLKAEGLNYDLFGHDGWLLRMPDFTPRAAVDRIHKLLAEADAISQGLRQKMPEVKRNSLLAGELLQKVARG